MAVASPERSAVHGVPERSLVQRRDALRRANAVRSYRKGLKGDLKHYRREVGPVLSDPPGELDTMKVIDLLLAMPKVGRVKANKWLGQVKVSPAKTVGGLSERQRRELLALVRRRC